MAKRVDVRVGLNNQVEKDARRIADGLNKVAKKQISDEEKARIASQKKIEREMEASAKRAARARERAGLTGLQREERESQASERRKASDARRIERERIAERKRDVMAAIRAQEREEMASQRRISQEATRNQRYQQQQWLKDLKSRQREQDRAAGRPGNNLKTAARLSMAADGVEQLSQPIRGFVRSAAQEYLAYDRAIQGARIKARLAPGSEEFKKLDASARSVGANTIFSATDAAQATERMVAQGVPLQDIPKTLARIADVAIVEMTSMEEAYNSVSAAQAGYGHSLERLTKDTDVLSAASDASRASITDISDGLREMGATAKNFGVSFEDSAAILAAFSETGSNASEGGIAGRNFLTRLGAVTKDTAVQQLEGIGIKGGFVDISDPVKAFSELDRLVTAKYGPSEGVESDASGRSERGKFLKTVFDERGMNDVATFMDLLRRGKVQNIRSEIDRGTGGLSEKANQLNQTAAANVEKFNSALSELKLTFAENLAPQMTAVVQGLTSATEMFGEFAKVNPATTKALGYALLTLGGLGIVLPAVARSLAAIKLTAAAFSRGGGPGIGAGGTAILGAGGRAGGKGFRPRIGTAIGAGAIAGTMLADGIASGQSLDDSVADASLAGLGWGPWGSLIAAAGGVYKLGKHNYKNDQDRLSQIQMNTGLSRMSPGQMSPEQRAAALRNEQADLARKEAFYKESYGLGDNSFMGHVKGAFSDDSQTDVAIKDLESRRALVKELQTAVKADEAKIQLNIKIDQLGRFLGATANSSNSNVAVDTGQALPAA